MAKRVMIPKETKYLLNRLRTAGFRRFGEKVRHSFFLYSDVVLLVYIEELLDAHALRKSKRIPGEESRSERIQAIGEALAKIEGRIDKLEDRKRRWGLD